MSEIISIFHELDKEKLERFEKIILNKSIRSTIEATKLYCPDQIVDMYVHVILIGIDKKTKFETRFNCSTKTFEEAVEEFLGWWDREVVRFNSLNQLTNRK